jgi:signal transduction histidine kinase/CheY-like chemotaxis protein
MHSNCVILIVDDSEVDRLTYRRYLEYSNNTSNNILSFHILDCESAESALELCDRHSPDVILLDYLLPDSDGIELLQILAEQLESLPPVIMLTGQGSESVAVAAMKHGARDYLIKGKLTSQNLVNSILSALTEQTLQLKIDRQRQQRELLANIALKISHSVKLSKILQSTVEGARTLLGCDRSIIYQLSPDRSGAIVSESITPKWSTALGSRLEDHAFIDEQAFLMNDYRRGRRTILTDVETDPDLADWHRNMLNHFQVKSLLVVPISYREPQSLSEPSLWGLLIAHHCEKVHQWQSDEINVLDELSMQMAIAIQQAKLMSDLEETLEKQRLIEHELSDRVIEIEQANLQLSQATKLLEVRNKELDEFAYIASHDLQAPLRGISNLAEWFIKDLETQLPLENQHQLTLIQSRIEKMEALINGLLQYARVGRENTICKLVNIKILLEEVIELLDPPIDFQIKIPASLPTIETEDLLLKQVLSNLISNAIKYHDRRDGKIEILVIDQPSYLQFTVLDDGPGIALENHQKIFGIFQTLVSRDDMKGTGIGLAIIKKIVEGRGGAVWVESAIGKGSAFSFTWPLDPPSLLD